MQFSKESFWQQCHGILDNQRIKHVQSTLNIKFPCTYVELIKDCDGGIPLKSSFEYFDQSFEEIWRGSIGSFLPLNFSEYGDVISDNKSPPEFFPEDLIGFAEVGNGDYICFDYRQSKDNSDPPIVYWSHGADVGCDVSFIANNFKEFIGMLKESDD